MSRKLWVRFLRGAGVAAVTSVAVLACWILSFFSIAAWDANRMGVSVSQTPFTHSSTILLLLASLPLPLTLFVRRRLPWLPAVAGTASVFVLQLDPLLALLGISTAIHRGTGKPMFFAVCAGLAATLWTGAREVIRPWDRNSWSLFFEPSVAGGGGDPGLISRVAISFAATSLSAGAATLIGYLRRSRSELRRAQDVALGERSQRVKLSTQVAHQEERDKVAREVHDALAHRLSLISLHSGALETAAHAGNPQLAQAAEVLRSNAHQSLEDLRSLIGTLRASPETSAAVAHVPHAKPAVGLGEIASLLDSSENAGLRVTRRISLEHPDRVNDLLGRAAYRIAQEALTNVLKHAPGSPVLVWLSCSPDRGIRLVIRNLLPRTASGPPDGLGYSEQMAELASAGAGAGIIGIKERVALLGGSVSIGRSGWNSHPEFVVDVALPWRGAEAELSSSAR